MISYHRADISDTEDLIEQRIRFIRDSRPEMEASLIDIYREPLRQYYAEAIPTGECIYWLARDGQQTVGGGGMALRRYAPGLMLKDGVSAYVFNIYVAPEYRRRGIARELVLRLMDEARTRGIGRLDLHATEAGRPLYENLGFEKPDHLWLEWRTEKK